MKAIGIGAIISAFFFFARILIRRKKAEIDCLAELGRGMELMRAELGTRLTPMPELMRLLSDRCGGAAGSFFSAVYSAMPLLEERDFSGLWNIAAESCLIVLDKRALDTVKKAGTVLGRYELAEQLSAVGSCAAELKTREEKLRAAYPESRRLMFGLCAAAGSFLILLLL